MNVLHVTRVIIGLVEGAKGYGPSQSFTVQVRREEHADPLLRGVEHPRALRQGLMLSSCPPEDGDELSIGNARPHQTRGAEAVQEHVIAICNMLKDELSEL